MSTADGLQSDLEALCEEVAATVCVRDRLRDCPDEEVHKHVDPFEYDRMNGEQRQRLAESFADSLDGEVCELLERLRRLMVVSPVLAAWLAVPRPLRDVTVKRGVL